jgi:hypothetical protein
LQAAWFVLADKPPVVPPVRALTVTHGPWESLYNATIVITALPHVSPESVAGIFARAKSRLFGAGPLPDIRRHVMAAFTENEDRREGKKLPLLEQQQRWNKEWPGWEYLDRKDRRGRVIPGWRDMARAKKHEKEALEHARERSNREAANEAAQRERDRTAAAVSRETRT